MVANLSRRRRDSGAPAAPRTCAAAWPRRAAARPAWRTVGNRHAYRPRRPHLGPEEDVAVEHVLARGRVAREEHARSRVRSSVAEDHGLNDHRGAEVTGDALSLAIGTRPVAVPGAEDGFDGTTQLEPGSLERTLRQRCRSTSIRKRARHDAAKARSSTWTARPSVVAAFRPRFSRIVSSIPGMETGAPERTLTNSAGHGRRRSHARHAPMRTICVRSSAVQSVGQPPCCQTLQASVVIAEAGRHGQAQLVGHDAQVGALAPEEHRQRPAVELRRLVEQGEQVMARACPPVRA